MTQIELKDDHYCFVLDSTGEFVEIYMPDNNPDAYVPDNVVRIVQMIADANKSTLDLSHDALIDKR